MDVCVVCDTIRKTIRAHHMDIYVYMYMYIYVYILCVIPFEKPSGPIIWQGASYGWFFEWYHTQHTHAHSHTHI